jgi:Zn-dependent protease
LGDVSGDLRAFVLLLPILVLSMTLHELAHGYVAWRLGDSTARLLGRLSPNPLAHLDPLGTAMFAITYFIDPMLMFGWARPVPVVPSNFRSPQRGMALVGVAGPLTNFAIALGFMALHVHAPPAGILGDVVVYAVVVNVVLGVFNLLPAPPLDGSRIVGGLMTDTTYRAWSALDAYGMVVLLLLLVVFRTQTAAVVGGATRHVLSLLRTVVGG